MASSRFGERLQVEAERQREQAVTEKNRVQDMIGRVAASLSVLNDFSTRLKENIATTRTISQEITAAFTQLTTSIETQTRSITDLNESIQEIEQAVESLAAASADMKALSDNSVRLTSSGRAEALNLSEKMNRVQGVMEQSAAIMDELHAFNEKIHEIVEAINQIPSKRSCSP
ncbi:MAG TPA: hypothetical protein VIL22_00905 [Paenibacillaceae bacterium]